MGPQAAEILQRQLYPLQPQVQNGQPLNRPAP